MKKSVKKVAKKVVKVAKVEPKAKEYKIPSTGIVAPNPIIKG